MSLKQEIYRDILSWGLPYARNGLSRFHQRPSRWPKLLWPPEQRALQRQYQVAQFVHNIYFLILDEEFTLLDVSFLNFEARRFFERGDERDCFHVLFAFYIQGLLAEVPEAMRPQLACRGTTGATAGR